MSRSMYGGVTAVFACSVVALSIYGVRDYLRSRERSTPAVTSPSATAEPPSIIEQRVSAAMAVQPPIEALRSRVRAAIPQIRAHIEAGRRKPRTGLACTIDLRDRHDKLNALLASTAGAETSVWMLWDDPQRDLVDGLENAIIPTRLCVDCAAEDVKECAAASTDLKKLEALVKQ